MNFKVYNKLINYLNNKYKNYMINNNNLLQLQVLQKL